MEYSEEQINRLLESIYNGSITVEQLPIGLYKAIANELKKGIYEGFKKTLIETQFGTPDYQMLKDLRENAYVFSGAKTFQEVKELTELIVKDNKILPFNEFKKLALDKYQLYNKTYLESEYNFAVGQANMASQWLEFENNKDILPYLQYKTIHDSNVRHDHAVLDNIIRKKDDPFWKTYYPKNGWNCRCEAVEVHGGEETNLKHRTLPELEPLFNSNVGLDRAIFTPDHLYFDVPKEYKNLAKNNFNLKIPKND